MIVQSTAPTTVPQNTTQTPPSQTVDKNGFLKLLIAQLQNQDPLQPMDNQQFAVQLATFNSLEQLMDINKQLTALQTTQGQSTQFNAASLIGKQINAEGNNIAVESSAPAKLNYQLSANAANVTLKIQDSNGTLIRQLETGAQGAGDQTFTWDGQDATGRAVSDGIYTFQVNAVNANGKQIGASSRISGTVKGVNLAGAGASARPWKFAGALKQCDRSRGTAVDLGNMSIIGSIFNATGALSAFGNLIEATGDNISNLNTVGFKSGVARFADLLPTVDGQLQIGHGTRLEEIISPFQQGGLESTSAPTDLAIQGNGYFIVKDPVSSASYYTRAGQFHPDAAGKLVNARGFVLQGAAGDIVIDPTSSIPGRPTTSVDLSVNLDASAQAPAVSFPVTADASPASWKAGSNFSHVQMIYDSSGTAHDLTIVFRRTAANAWEIGCWRRAGILTAQLRQAQTSGRSLMPDPSPLLRRAISTSVRVTSPEFPASHGSVAQARLLRQQI